MKKYLLTTLFLLNIFCAAFVFAQNPVSNPGFENWANGNPVSWMTSNVPGIGTPVTQGAPHAGLHSLRGDVITGIAGVIPPVVYQIGIMIAQNYATLDFYYQYNRVGTGTFDASAIMYSNGSTVVAAADQSFTSSVVSWTQANIPFTYISSGADSCVIVFAINDQVNPDPDPGNYFLVDDVSLSGVVVIDEQSTVKDFAISKIQPNPASDNAFIYYSLPRNEHIKFELLDVAGKICRTIDVTSETAGKHRIELNVTELPAGIYMLRMTTSDAVATAKVIVAK